MLRSGDRNEATTRLHLIDTLLYECLGWLKFDVIPEVRQDGQYADYTFYAPRQVMILEAKREGDYFDLPTDRNHLTYDLTALAHTSASLRAAIGQVSDYCHSRGIQTAAISNGHQVVAFIANRSDGVPFMDGKAIVFPSLEFMQNHFGDLWNALSKPATEESKLRARLLGKSAPSVPSPLAARLDVYPGTKGRNLFQTDLQVLSDLVIEDIARSRELERRFLEECYCENGTLSHYSLISKSILSSRYNSLFDGANPGPSVVPVGKGTKEPNDFLAEVMSRRPILLLGDIGVGKTTFIRHLIKIDAANLLENAYTFYLNFGSQANLTSDLDRFIVDEMRSQLRNIYEVNIEQYNFVRGVYYRELDDFRDGIYCKLRESDPPAFRQKESSLLESLVADKAEHLRKSLSTSFADERSRLSCSWTTATNADLSCKTTFF